MAALAGLLVGCIASNSPKDVGDASDAAGMDAQVSPPCREDGFGPSAPGAPAATLGPGRYGPLVVCPGEPDHFFVRPGTDEVYQVRVQALAGPGVGLVVGGADETPPTDTVAVEASLGPTELQIRTLSADADTAARYVLEVEAAPRACVPDALERLSGGQGARRVVVCPRSTVRLTAEPTAPPGVVTLRLVAGEALWRTWAGEGLSGHGDRALFAGEALVEPWGPRPVTAWTLENPGRGAVVVEVEATPAGAPGEDAPPGRVRWPYPGDLTGIEVVTWAPTRLLDASTFGPAPGGDAPGTEAVLLGAGQVEVEVEVRSVLKDALVRPLAGSGEGGQPWRFGPLGLEPTASPGAGVSAALGLLAWIRGARDLDALRFGAGSARLVVEYSPGRAARCGTCFAPGAVPRVFLSGLDGEDDAAEPSVVLHEYGHAVAAALGIDESPGGPHDGDRAAPALAWSEGFASFYAAATLGDPVLEDRGPGGVRTLNLETLPSDDARAMGVEGDAESHRVSEYLVAAMLWDLYDNTPTEEPVHLGEALWTLLAEGLAARAVDAGPFGLDLTDVLAVLVCAGPDQAAAVAVVANAVQFPLEAATATCAGGSQVGLNP